MDPLKIMKLFSEKNLIEAKIKAAVATAEQNAIRVGQKQAGPWEAASEALKVFKKEMGEFLQKEFGGII